MNFFNKIKGYIGIFLILTAIGIIFYWESYGREKLLYKDIVVFKDYVLPKTIITEDMITFVKREENTLIKNVITNPKDVIGLESKQFIPRYSQLHPKFFDVPELVLDDDEFIFSIPKDWILAFPSTLRRKDTIYFYEITNNSFVNDLYIKSKKNISSENNYMQNFENDKVDISNIETTKDALIKTTVAYVKDNVNREVVSIDDERLNASSNISDIEIIITIDMLNKLKNSVAKGNKFIILYQ